MILSGIRKSIIKRKIKDFLQNKKPLSNANNLKSVGVIVDVDQFSSIAHFLELKNKLSANEVDLIAFSNNKKLIIDNANLLFTPSEIKIGGSIKSPELKQFIEKEFDLLIGYTNNGQMAFNYVIAATAANLKVGIDLENEDLYDIIIKTDIVNIDAFFSELVKYLKILKILEHE